MNNGGCGPNSVCFERPSLSSSSLNVRYGGGGEEDGSSSSSSSLMSSPVASVLCFCQEGFVRSPQKDNECVRSSLSSSEMPVSSSEITMRGGPALLARRPGVSSVSSSSGPSMMVMGPQSSAMIEKLKTMDRLRRWRMG